MASYKSQFVPPRRIEDRVPTTRLPQRSVTPVTHVSQLPAASQSKLQKRRPSRDEPMYPSRGSSNQTDPSTRVSSRQGSTGSAVPVAASLPRTNIHNTSRLPKLEVPTTIHTPSLFSGSSASTIESPRSNVLRRNLVAIETIRCRLKKEGSPLKGCRGGARTRFPRLFWGYRCRQPRRNSFMRSQMWEGCTTTSTTMRLVR
jgi:hypothetical protein